MNISQSSVSFPDKTFSARLIGSIKTITFFIIFLTIVMCSGSKSTMIIGLLISFAIFLFYLIEHANWSRYYITDISLRADSKIKIIYYDRNLKREYITNLKSLTFDKKFVWYKIRGQRAPYLFIQNLNDGFKIKQYGIGDWNEATIDKI